VFDAVLREVCKSASFTEELDKGLLHLFYSYQASSVVKENYQWLPLAQGIYSMALFRGDGEKLVERRENFSDRSEAITAEEFKSLIRLEVRDVEPIERAWTGLLFLLENRTMRGKAIEALVEEALRSCDALTIKLIMKGLDLSLSSGWKSCDALLGRAFQKFWSSRKQNEQAILLGQRLAITGRFGQLKLDDPTPVWRADWTDELWRKLSTESAESVWQTYERWVGEGVSLDQLFGIQMLFRGRCLFAMKSEQWPRVCESIEFADALLSASRWLPQARLTFLAIHLFDLIEVVRQTGSTTPALPTGQDILDGVSKNISKDRLILRLEDAVERGERQHALELMAVILKDQGLTHSMTDRVVLMASKQDGWTFDFKTLSTATVLTRAFDAVPRWGFKGDAIAETLYGLLRFLSDERELSTQMAKKTGTYGEGLSHSQFDVSSGARIVDRFVFNQMRNGQRIKIWPSNN